MNIRTQLNKAERVLFSDMEIFNKDITGVKSLDDIKAQLHIRGKLRKVAYSGNHVTYRLVGTGYEFTLTLL